MSGASKSVSTFAEIVTNTYGWNVMKPHSTDKDLWVNFFQESLSGTQLDWFYQLERADDHNTAAGTLYFRRSAGTGRLCTPGSRRKIPQKKRTVFL